MPSEETVRLCRPADNQPSRSEGLPSAGRKTLCLSVPCLYHAHMQTVALVKMGMERDACCCIVIGYRCFFFEILVTCSWVDSVAGKTLRWFLRTWLRPWLRTAWKAWPVILLFTFVSLPLITKQLIKYFSILVLFVLLVSCPTVNQNSFYFYLCRFHIIWQLHHTFFTEESGSHWQNSFNIVHLP